MKQSLLGSQFVYMGIFGDDFATVDFHEELCYHSRPKKTNLRGTYTTVRVQKVRHDFLAALRPHFSKNYRI